MRLIDADNVIEKIESAMKNFPLSDRRETSTGIRIALFDIKQMIDEQPTISQWIPVNERLPEEYEEVLVTLVSTEKGGGYTGVAMDCIAYDGKWFAHYSDSVIAWMPLPEPYKESD